MALDMGDRRFRHDAMAEIEDERPARERLQNRVNGAIERRPAGDQHQRIEIALHRHAALHPLAHKTAIHHPIEADRIDRELLDIARQQRAGAARKADHLGARDLRRAPWR